MHRPTVYSIPIGAPFLPTLADAFLGGQFGAVDPGDPLSMTDATVLLPTRRAARTFRKLLLERSTSRSVLMPRVRPIGDIDEDEHLLVAPSEDGAGSLSLPLAITGLERRLVLSGLVLAWGDSVRRAEGSADEEAIIPSSAADAFKLSGDLSRLIDDMETAGIGWETLRTLAPSEYAGYWQLTLEFLKIAGEQWPRFLAEIGRVDPARRRDQLIRAHAARLAATSPRGPVIAAGSTGSIPATAELLKTIARLPNGTVILPGLDISMDDATWSAVCDNVAADSGSPSHPQFGMKRLLSAMAIDRRDVEKLGHASRLVGARATVVSEAMRPASTTDRWIESPVIGSGAFDDVVAIIAGNEEEEALSIAIALREAVETPGRTAALVTPDRILARRVVVELRRWRIRIDDSAGQPLAATMPGVLARLLAEAAFTGVADIVAAVGKHPLARFQSSRLRCRRASEALEIALLRGPSSEGSIATLPRRLADMRLATEMRTERFAPRARRRLGKFEWNAAEALANRYAAALGSLEALGTNGPINVSDATRLLTGAIEAATDDGEGNGGSVWSDPAGEALAELLGSLIDTERLSLPPREYPAFIAAAMN
ncbi:MAG: double-strand break repair protein AddB, partial [Alphaproteobacteria bacterium]